LDSLGVIYSVQALKFNFHLPLLFRNGNFIRLLAAWTCASFFNQNTIALYAPMEYVTASQLLEASQKTEPTSTGSPELDTLLGGGIHRGFFYLFYGEETLIDTLFQHLTTHALKTNDRGRPKTIYMLAGNYCKERTTLSIEELAELA